jgi:WD40 repeat protein
LQREATAPLDIHGYKLNEIAMGSASDGPLWVIASAPQAHQTMSSFMDIATFKHIPLQRTGDSFFLVQENGNIRVSANGRVFAMWLSNSSPQGVQTFVMQGNEARGYRKHETAGHLLPDADGKMIYTQGVRYTSQTLPVGEPPKKRRFCLPATQSNYYMDIEGDTITNLTQKSDGTVVVYLAGNDKPLAKLTDIDLPRLTFMAARDRLTGDKRIHFIPSAKVIVTIPDASDRVVLHRFDVEEALEKSGIEYLFVASQPPLRAKTGTTYRYQLAVKSKKGGIKYGVESGPTEMKISDTGLVTWDVPRSLSESQVDVILTISDKSGQEIFHTFHLIPGDQGEEQNAAAADVPKEPVKSDEIKEKPQSAKQPEPVQPAAPPQKEGGVRELRTIRISRNNYAHAMTFTPDSRELLSAGDDGRMRRWSVADGRELSTSFDPHPRVTMFSVGLSADGKLMVTSGLDKTAKVWELATTKLRTTCTHTDRIPHVRAALSPDGKIVATATNQVHLWDAESGHELELLKTPLGAVDALVFSPDGKRLAFGGSRNTVKVWDVAERKELASLSGHSRLITGLAFAPDGKTLASVSVDRTIKLWNLETNKERLTLTGHAEALSSVAFSPDGKLLVSGAGATRVEPSRRGEVKLWDAATGQLLTDLRGHTDGVSSVAFAPDGKTVATASRDHTVRLWDVSAHSKR